MTILDLIPEDEAEKIKASFSRLIREGANSDETDFIRKDGSRRTWQVNAVKLSEERYLGFARDVTEIKRNREELRKIERLTSLGVLAGGIAHDFNNLLTAIIGNLSILKLEISEESQLREIISEALTASETAQSLTRQLLVFSRGGEPFRQLADPGRLLREAAVFVLRGSNVRAVYEIAGDLAHAEVDVGQFKQVIQNLVINADQAMPEGGLIEIAAGNVDLEKASGFLEPGRYIRITITDHGVGIGEETLAKIFDPYFTTKQKGSGLGLAVVDSIIRNHGGRIEAGSEVGTGTTFTIYLPASDQRAEEGEEERAEIPAEKRTGRILIMDDEPGVLKVAERMVSRAGWEADTAAAGEEAVEKYQNAFEAGEPFRAVILDLTVAGGMGGRETAEAILKIDPEAVLIVSSGYSNEPVIANFRDYGFKGVILKPYMAAQLINELERVVKAK